MPSGKRNVARRRHDKTIEIALGLRGSMAKKKGRLRFCCDFRYLNAVTIKDAYPKTRIGESLSKLGNQWKRMPFGLCNATATFQRLMAQVFLKVTKKYRNLVMWYVDDVVIGTLTLADHVDRLEEVFNCMKTAGLKCKSQKCEILRDSSKYLGRIVDRHGVRSYPEAVEAVLTWKAARTDTQLMSFLGFANYYR